MLYFCRLPVVRRWHKAAMKTVITRIAGRCHFYDQILLSILRLLLFWRIARDFLYAYWGFLFIQIISPFLTLVNFFLFLTTTEYSEQEERKKDMKEGWKERRKEKGRKEEKKEFIFKKKKINNIYRKYEWLR